MNNSNYVCCVFVDVKGDKDHPICPVLLGDAKLAADFADLMLSMFHITSLSILCQFMCVSV